MNHIIKKEKFLSPRNLILLAFVVILFVLALIFINGNQKPIEKTTDANLILPPAKIIEKLYGQKDIFSQIPFKSRQISLDQKIIQFSDRSIQSGDFYFSVASRKELGGFSDDELIPIKCMPEQIYLKRAGKYSIALENGSYEEVNLVDPEVLQLISRLQGLMSKGYDVTQFLACKTADNRLIVKYNGIKSESIKKGFGKGIAPVAFFTQFLSNGEARDVAYIQLANLNTFCRTPIQLTRNNIFYFDCSVYPSIAGRISSPVGSYLYKIDMNKLNYSLVSHCTFNSLKAQCEE